jgi:hypothetical protein
VLLFALAFAAFALGLVDQAQALRLLEWPALFDHPSPLYWSSPRYSSSKNASLVFVSRLVVFAVLGSQAADPGQQVPIHHLQVMKSLMLLTATPTLTFFLCAWTSPPVFDIAAQSITDAPIV